MHPQRGLAKLNEALLQRELQVYEVPLFGSGRARVDSDLFALHALTVDLDGRIWPDYDYAAFEPDEVKKLWPPESPTTRRMRNFMLGEAKNYLESTGKKLKQPELVKRCQENSAVLSRVAIAVARALPAEICNSRGRPPN